jgi:hypothetical protein
MLHAALHALFVAPCVLLSAPHPSCSPLAHLPRHMARSLRTPAAAAPVKPGKTTQSCAACMRVAPLR